MIIHIDMDAFYASVEQRDNPELRGKPVIVGGSPEGRGVVSTASYEARKFGIRSAMPTSQAIRLCPTVTVVRTRMQHYASVSRQIRAIFSRYTPEIEPLSLDEAFLDVSGCESLFGSAVTIGREIQLTIQNELHLSASVGIATNKFLAKLASDLDKPNGLTIIPPNGTKEFLAPLSVTRLWGVGKATLKKFEAVNLHRFADLHALTIEQAQQLLGSRMGAHFWKLAHGLDSRAVSTDRIAKTISNETTFPSDVSDHEELRARMLELTDRLAQRLRESNARGRTISVKVRFSDFETLVRSHSLPNVTYSTIEIWSAVTRLLDDALLCCKSRSVRLLGVGISNFGDPPTRQLDLFADQAEAPKKNAGPANQAKLDAAADAIRQQFGAKSLLRGSSLTSRSTQR